MNESPVGFPTDIPEELTDLFYRYYFPVFRPFHWSLVHVAALGGQVTILRDIISRSADVLLARTVCGWTPLHIATAAILVGEVPAMNYIDSARLLLHAGTPIDVTDVDGHTPLHIAVRCGNAHVASFLLSAGADPRHRSKVNLSPLDIASVRWRANPTVQALLPRMWRPRAASYFPRGVRAAAQGALMCGWVLGILGLGRSPRGPPPPGSALSHPLATWTGAAHAGPQAAADVRERAQVALVPDPNADACRPAHPADPMTLVEALASSAAAATRGCTHKASHAAGYAAPPGAVCAGAQVADAAVRAILPMLRAWAAGAIAATSGAPRPPPPQTTPQATGPTNPHPPGKHSSGEAAATITNTRANVVTPPPRAVATETGVLSPTPTFSPPQPAASTMPPPTDPRTPPPFATRPAHSTSRTSSDPSSRTPIHAANSATPPSRHHITPSSSSPPPLPTPPPTQGAAVHEGPSGPPSTAPPATAEGCNHHDRDRAACAPLVQYPSGGWGVFPGTGTGVPSSTYTTTSAALCAQDAGYAVSPKGPGDAPGGRHSASPPQHPDTLGSLCTVGTACDAPSPSPPPPPPLPTASRSNPSPARTHHRASANSPASRPAAGVAGPAGAPKHAPMDHSLSGCTVDPCGASEAATPVDCVAGGGLADHCGAPHDDGRAGAAPTHAPSTAGGTGVRAASVPPVAHAAAGALAVADPVVLADQPPAAPPTPLALGIADSDPTVRMCDVPHILSTVSELTHLSMASVGSPGPCPGALRTTPLQRPSRPQAEGTLFCWPGTPGAVRSRASTAGEAPAPPGPSGGTATAPGPAATSARGPSSGAPLCPLLQATQVESTASVSLPSTAAAGSQPGTAALPHDTTAAAGAVPCPEGGPRSIGATSVPPPAGGSTVGVQPTPQGLQGPRPPGHSAHIAAHCPGVAAAPAGAAVAVPSRTPPWAGWGAVGPAAGPWPAAYGGPSATAAPPLPPHGAPHVAVPPPSDAYPTYHAPIGFAPPPMYVLVPAAYPDPWASYGGGWPAAAHGAGYDAPAACMYMMMRAVPMAFQMAAPVTGVAAAAAAWSMPVPPAPWHQPPTAPVPAAGAGATETNPSSRPPQWPDPRHMPMAHLSDMYPHARARACGHCGGPPPAEAAAPGRVAEACNIAATQAVPAAPVVPTSAASLSEGSFGAGLTDRPVVESDAALVPLQSTVHPSSRVMDWGLTGPNGTPAAPLATTMGTPVLERVARTATPGHVPNETGPAPPPTGPTPSREPTVSPPPPAVLTSPSPAGAADDARTSAGGAPKPSSTPPLSPLQDGSVHCPSPPSHAQSPSPTPHGIPPTPVETSAASQSTAPHIGLAAAALGLGAGGTRLASAASSPSVACSPLQRGPSAHSSASHMVSPQLATRGHPGLQRAASGRGSALAAAASSPSSSAQPRPPSALQSTGDFDANISPRPPWHSASAIPPHPVVSTTTTTPRAAAAATAASPRNPRALSPWATGGAVSVGRPTGGPPPAGRRRPDSAPSASSHTTSGHALTRGGSFAESVGSERARRRRRSAPDLHGSGLLWGSSSSVTLGSVPLGSVGALSASSLVVSGLRKLLSQDGAGSAGGSVAELARLAAKDQRAAESSSGAGQPRAQEMCPEPCGERDERATSKAETGTLSARDTPGHPSASTTTQGEQPPHGTGVGAVGAVPADASATDKAAAPAAAATSARRRCVPRPRRWCLGDGGGALGADGGGEKVGTAAGDCSWARGPRRLRGVEVQWLDVASPEERAAATTFPAPHERALCGIEIMCRTLAYVRWAFAPAGTCVGAVRFVDGSGEACDDDGNDAALATCNVNDGAGANTDGRVTGAVAGSAEAAATSTSGCDGSQEACGVHGHDAEVLSRFRLGDVHGGDTEVADDYYSAVLASVGLVEEAVERPQGEVGAVTTADMGVPGTTMRSLVAVPTESLAELSMPKSTYRPSVQCTILLAAIAAATSAVASVITPPQEMPWSAAVAPCPTAAAVLASLERVADSVTRANVTRGSGPASRLAHGAVATGYESAPGMPNADSGAAAASNAAQDDASGPQGHAHITHHHPRRVPFCPPLTLRRDSGSSACADTPSNSSAAAPWTPAPGWSPALGPARSQTTSMGTPPHGTPKAPTPGSLYGGTSHGAPHGSLHGPPYYGTPPLGARYGAPLAVNPMPPHTAQYTRRTSLGAALRAAAQLSGAGVGVGVGSDAAPSGAAAAGSPGSVSRGSASRSATSNVHGGQAASAGSQTPATPDLSGEPKPPALDAFPRASPHSSGAGTPGPRVRAPLHTPHTRSARKGSDSSDVAPGDRPAPGRGEWAVTDPRASDTDSSSGPPRAVRAPSAAFSATFGTMVSSAASTPPASNRLTPAFSPTTAHPGATTGTVTTPPPAATRASVTDQIPAPSAEGLPERPQPTGSITQSIRSEPRPNAPDTARPDPPGEEDAAHLQTAGGASGVGACGWGPPPSWWSTSDTGQPALTSGPVGPPGGRRDSPSDAARTPTAPSQPRDVASPSPHVATTNGGALASHRSGPSVSPSAELLWGRLDEPSLRPAPGSPPLGPLGTPSPAPATPTPIPARHRERDHVVLPTTTPMSNTAASPGASPAAASTAPPLRSFSLYSIPQACSPPTPDLACAGALPFIVRRSSLHTPVRRTAVTPTRQRPLTPSSTSANAANVATPTAGGGASGALYRTLSRGIMTASTHSLQNAGGQPSGAAPCIGPPQLLSEVPLDGFPSVAYPQEQQQRQQEQQQRQQEQQQRHVGGAGVGTLATTRRPNTMNGGAAGTATLADRRNQSFAAIPAARTLAVTGVTRSRSGSVLGLKSRSGSVCEMRITSPDPSDGLLLWGAGLADDDDIETVGGSDGDGPCPGARIAGEASGDASRSSVPPSRLEDGGGGAEGGGSRARDTPVSLGGRHVASGNDSPSDGVESDGESRRSLGPTAKVAETISGMGTLAQSFASTVSGAQRFTRWSRRRPGTEMSAGRYVDGHAVRFQTINGERPTPPSTAGGTSPTSLVVSYAGLRGRGTLTLLPVAVQGTQRPRWGGPPSSHTVVWGAERDRHLLLPSVDVGTAETQGSNPGAAASECTTAVTVGPTAAASVLAPPLVVNAGALAGESTTPGLLRAAVSVVSHGAYATIHNSGGDSNIWYPPSDLPSGEAGGSKHSLSLTALQSHPSLALCGGKARSATPTAPPTPPTGASAGRPVDSPCTPPLRTPCSRSPANSPPILIAQPTAHTLGSLPRTPLSLTNTGLPPSQSVVSRSDLAPHAVASVSPPRRGSPSLYAASIPLLQQFQSAQPTSGRIASLGGMVRIPATVWSSPSRRRAVSLDMTPRVALSVGSSATTAVVPSVHHPHSSLLGGSFALGPQTPVDAEPDGASAHVCSALTAVHAAAHAAIGKAGAATETDCLRPALGVPSMSGMESFADIRRAPTTPPRQGEVAAAGEETGCVGALVVPLALCALVAATWAAAAGGATAVSNAVVDGVPIGNLGHGTASDDEKGGYRALAALVDSSVHCVVLCERGAVFVCSPAERENGTSVSRGDLRSSEVVDTTAVHASPAGGAAPDADDAVLLHARRGAPEQYTQSRGGSAPKSPTAVEASTSREVSNDTSAEGRGTTPEPSTVTPRLSTGPAVRAGAPAVMRFHPPVIPALPVSNATYTHTYLASILPPPPPLAHAPCRGWTVVDGAWAYTGGYGALDADDPRHPPGVRRGIEGGFAGAPPMGLPLRGGGWYGPFSRAGAQGWGRYGRASPAQGWGGGGGGFTRSRPGGYRGGGGFGLADYDDDCDDITTTTPTTPQIAPMPRSRSQSRSKMQPGGHARPGGGLTSARLQQQQRALFTIGGFTKRAVPSYEPFHGSADSYPPSLNTSPVDTPLDSPAVSVLTPAVPTGSSAAPIPDILSASAVGMTASVSAVSPFPPSAAGSFPVPLNGAIAAAYPHSPGPPRGLRSGGRTTPGIYSALRRSDGSGHRGSPGRGSSGGGGSGGGWLTGPLGLITFAQSGHEGAESPFVSTSSSPGPITDLDYVEADGTRDRLRDLVSRSDPGANGAALSPGRPVTPSASAIRLPLFSATRSRAGGSSGLAVPQWSAVPPGSTRGPHPSSSTYPRGSTPPRTGGGDDDSSPAVRTPQRSVFTCSASNLCTPGGRMYSSFGAVPAPMRSQAASADVSQLDERSLAVSGDPLLEDTSTGRSRDAAVASSSLLRTPPPRTHGLPSDRVASGQLSTPGLSPLPDTLPRAPHPRDASRSTLMSSIGAHDLSYGPLLSVATLATASSLFPLRLSAPGGLPGPASEYGSATRVDGRDAAAPGSAGLSAQPRTVRSPQSPEGGPAPLFGSIGSVLSTSGFDPSRDPSQCDGQTGAASPLLTGATRPVDPSPSTTPSITAVLASVAAASAVSLPAGGEAAPGNAPTCDRPHSAEEAVVRLSDGGVTVGGPGARHGRNREHILDGVDGADGSSVSLAVVPGPIDGDDTATSRRADMPDESGLISSLPGAPCSSRGGTPIEFTLECGPIEPSAHMTG